MRLDFNQSFNALLKLDTREGMLKGDSLINLYNQSNEPEKRIIDIVFLMLTNKRFEDILEIYLSLQLDNELFYIKVLERIEKHNEEYNTATGAMIAMYHLFDWEQRRLFDKLLLALCNQTYISIREYMD